MWVPIKQWKQDREIATWVVWCHHPMMPSHGCWQIAFNVDGVWYDTRDGYPILDWVISHYIDIQPPVKGEK